MADKRLVHDILSESGTGPEGQKMQRRPVSFIQHGNLEDSFVYEGICPWCGTTLGYAPRELVNKTIGGLYRVLLSMQKMHWPSCEVSKEGIEDKEFAVWITDKPLNVEKLPQVVQDAMKENKNDRTH